MRAANYSRRSPLQDADDSGRVVGNPETMKKPRSVAICPLQIATDRQAPAWEAGASSKHEHLLRKQMICPVRCAWGCAAVKKSSGLSSPSRIDLEKTDSEAAT